GNPFSPCGRRWPPEGTPDEGWSREARRLRRASLFLPHCANRRLLNLKPSRFARSPSPETARSCGLFDVDVEAEGTDSVGEVSGRALRVSRPTVIGSEVSVEGSVFEHMVDDAQDRGGDGDERLHV